MGEIRFSALGSREGGEIRDPLSSFVKDESEWKKKWFDVEQLLRGQRK